MSDAVIDKEAWDYIHSLFSDPPEPLTAGMAMWIGGKLYDVEKYLEKKFEKELREMRAWVETESRRHLG